MSKYWIILIVIVLIVGLIFWHRKQKLEGTSFFNNNSASQSVTPLNNTSSLPSIKISGSQFIDSSTNQPIVLKGFVTVVNIYAYNDDSFQDYTPQDYQTMKSYGANYQSIRLGAKAIGGGSNSVDQSYLQRTDAMVANASAAGLYSGFKLTVFDLPGFSGLRKAQTWGDFWRNTSGQQDALIAGWKNVWTRYKDDSAVVGYDLLNEPSKGDLEVSDSQFVTNYLAPFYQKAIDALRTVDTTHLAYFQPGLNGFDDIPFRFVLNRSNIVYAPHFYPGVQAYLQALYGRGITTSLTSTYSSMMSQFLTDASTNNAPILMGEYGMPWDPKFDGDSSKTSVYASLESAAMDLFAQNHVSYSRPWYSDDRAGVKLPNVMLDWALIEGTNGLNGTPRDFILSVFKSHVNQ